MHFLLLYVHNFAIDSWYIIVFYRLERDKTLNAIQEDENESEDDEEDEDNKIKSIVKPSIKSIMTSIRKLDLNMCKSSMTEAKSYGLINSGEDTCLIGM